MKFHYLLIFIIAICCQQTHKNPQSTGHRCTPSQSRFNLSVSTTSHENLEVNKKEMVLVPSGTFSMDGDDDQVWRDEYPKHEVVVDSFWMDVHEVTNAQLAAFVKATVYMTIAEKAVDWEEIKKKILPSGKPKANTWEGVFPHRNDKSDGFYLTAPVLSYQPNGFGLYDMAGNVWEWCADLYHEDDYKTLADKTTLNLQGPITSYDSNEPIALKRVTRGGSFLCNYSYCSGYRNSMRIKTTPDGKHAYWV